LQSVGGGTISGRGLLKNWHIVELPANDMGESPSMVSFSILECSQNDYRAAIEEYVAPYKRKVAEAKAAYERIRAMHEANFNQ